MKCRLFISAIACATFLAHAAPKKFAALDISGKHYRDVTIIGANQTDLYFTHAKGISNVKLKFCPEELQKQFEFDPSSAAEAEQQQMQSNAKYHESVEKQIVEAARMKRLEQQAAATTTGDALADPVKVSSLLNKPAPRIEVERWIGEVPVTEGRPLLVFFWMPWSAPCRKQIEEYNGWKKTFGDKLSIIGIVGVRHYELNDYDGPKIEFGSGADSKRRLADLADVSSVPSVMLVDQHGIVRYVGHPGTLNEGVVQKILGLTPAPAAEK